MRTTILLLAAFLLLSPREAPAQSWSGLGYGATDWVYATTVWNGDLIAGGKFTWAGGVPANRIARWDGTSWAPLGEGFDGEVRALTVFRGRLVAGGFFRNSGAMNVNYIAEWDGTSWIDLEGGMNSYVVALTVWNNDLIAGGYFTDANGPANHVARWDGHTWFPLGSGTTGTEGQVMALGVYGSDLVAGGFFTSAGGSPAVHIAKWNGSTWSPLGAGISGIVYGLTAWNGNLVAGGLFYNAGGQPAHDIARWDGTSWFPFGSGIGATGYEYVFAVTPYNGDLIAGGIFTTAGGLPAYGAARWDGFKWSPLGSGFWNGGSVAGAYTLTPYGNDVVAGGIFTSAGGMGVGHIARWNEPFVAYGPACPGNGGALPVLSGVGWPGPGSVAGVALTGGRPSGSGLLLLGTGPGSASVLGCTFLLSGLLFGPIGVALDASGAFSFTWALPPGGATGTQAFFQFVGIDPGAPNGMFSASNGLKVTLQ